MTLSSTASTVAQHPASAGLRAAGTGWRAGLPRAALVAGMVAAVAVASIGARTVGPAVEGDSDLARVMAAMAVIKGGFALAAALLCFWRLARPAPPWLTSAYVAAPPAMAAGAIFVFQMRHLGLAAAALHLAMFGLVILALTDDGFLPPRRSPARPRA